VLFSLVLSHQEFLHIGFEFLVEELIWIHYLDFATPGNYALTTQSQLLSQPLIFELPVDSVKVHKIMIWYSANSIPISYRDSPIRSLDDEMFAYASVDQHWVWTSSHGNYLTKVSGIDSVVKGTMLFYPRLLGDKSILDSEHHVVVFDVTPQEVYSKINMIYAPGVVAKFMKDIIDVLLAVHRNSGVKITLVLKPKRDFAPEDAREYLDLIENWRKDGSLLVVSPQTNLYRIISESTAVISIPFTSPAIIGKELNIPTCYYSDLDTIVSPQIRDGIVFIRSKVELHDFIVNALKDNHKD